jgi:hypothetical protein
MLKAGDGSVDTSAGAR